MANTRAVWARRVCFGGISAKEATRNFEETKILDELKNKIIKEHEEDIRYFIRIPYTEALTEENITKILKENGISVPDILLGD
jgi:DNA-binding transcriptional regulator WhiA